jgi:nucleotide-binding universal stress UspA family protein
MIMHRRECNAKTPGIFLHGCYNSSVNRPAGMHPLGVLIMFHVRKVLYPTDFSSYSNQAYFHAVAQAEIHGASLTILYVYNASQRDGDKNYWRGQLEQIRPANSDIPVEHVLLEGDPAQEIIRYARDHQIDLIVLGTHGRTGKDRLLMGSVAEKVLRDGPCSVLVVKLPKGGSASVRPDVELTVNR